MIKEQSLNRKKFETEINGEKAVFEISDMAKQANGSVMGTIGDTVVLVTATMNDAADERPFFPLTVDYEERFYAIGKILGSRFMRREGRPSTEATLSARLIDRSIRPLFDERMRNPVQVVVTILSYDEKHDPDVIALISASLALGISDIPWNGPVAAISPTKDSIFAGIKDRINMIEFGDSEISEEEVEKHFDDAQKEIKRLAEFQEGVIKEIGKEKKNLEFAEVSKETEEFISKLISEKMDKAFEGGDVDALGDELGEFLKEKEADGGEKDAAYVLLEKKINTYVARKAIDDKKRIDGRAIDEIRPLYAEVGLFKRTHGSGLFMRGDTHLLSVTTTAPPSSEQLVETIEMSGSKRFMLHYNFPDYSVGEAGRAKSPGRREIGHGALAKKALDPFIPSKEEFPYTVRIVAETMSSNGSSSMATVCASSLSLMDAGVPIKSHVAGIAMGLMYDEKTKEYEILTDIQGPEDHYGGMDLKVAGTREGINAIQMDVKVDGLTSEMFKKGLIQAKKARMEIIEVMEKTIAEPRKELSPYAPVILIHKVDPSQIGEVIGPGGKMINGICEKAGNDTTIDIDDDGTVFISSTVKESAEKALEMVKAVTKRYEVGEMVEGTVEKILDFGAIVELGGGASGMIHVSELADKYVEKVTDIVKVGDRVKAKVIKIENGKMGLSMKGIDQS